MDNGIGTRIKYQMDYTVLHELAKFNKIIFFEEPHEYYINDVKKISATSLIGKFKPKFETETIATNYSEKHGLDKLAVIDEWDWKRDFSTIKGSLFHKYAENFLNNKILPYDGDYYQKLFGVDILKTKFNKLVELFHKFHSDSKDNLIPVKSEWIIGDNEIGICGCLDQIYFNKKSSMLEIWDWKTNKAIRTKNKYNNRFKHPVEHLDMCEFNTYSLQLSLYKYIVEKNTNLRIGNCYFVWFFEKNDEYKIFKVADLRDEIEALIKYAKQYKWL